MKTERKFWRRAAAMLLGAVLLMSPGLAFAAGTTWPDILDRYPGKEVEPLVGSLETTYWRSWQEAQEELAEQFMTMDLFTADGAYLPLGQQPERVSTGQYGCFYHDDYPDGARLFVLINKGDVLGNGKLNIAQLVRMAEHLTDRRFLTGVYEQAGDINGNGEVDIVDLAYLGLWLRNSIMYGPEAPRQSEGPMLQFAE